jgi:hypothetical protein
MKPPSIAMLAASLLAAGCAASALPDVAPLADPADPTLGLSDLRYRPVVGDYQHRQPVDPQNWRKLNEDLSPARRGAGS